MTEGVFTALMAKPLPDERIMRRPVRVVVVRAAPPPSPERTAAMRQENKANRAITAARYIPGVDTFRGQAQLHNFGPSKSVAENMPSPLFPVEWYLEMRDEFYGKQFLYAQRFGAIPPALMPGENSKRQTRAVACIHRWRYWGGCFEECAERRW